MATETTPTAPGPAPADRDRRRRAPALPPRSRLLSRLFLAYLHRYVPKHFHAVRVSRAGPLPVIDGPLLVVCNHPSWWDPLIALVLAARAGRAVYAPMDAAALDRYGLFRRLGMFGVRAGTPAGARTFLRVGRAVLEEPGAALVVTPQGRFADARERPVRIMSGVGHLARRVGRGTVLPVALEYPFWGERFPEALVHCGRPIRIHPGPSAAGWAERIADALARAQDALAAAAVRRDPAAFDVLLRGRVGVGGVYDAWRRLVATLTGRRFDPGHDPEGAA